MSDEMPTKYGLTISVSNEMLATSATIRSVLDSMFAPDTRSEAEIEADQRTRRAVAREKRRATEADHLALLALTTGLRRAVLELHGPHFSGNEYDGDAYCEGCDMDGYEVESPQFPCRTYELASEWPPP